MSLNFDLTEMKKRLGEEEYNRITNHPNPDCKEWHPVTNALIWATVYVGIGEITKKSAHEFSDRLAAFQAVSGALLATDKGKIFVTKEDVRNHIGLRTNVAKESAATFKTKIFRMALDAGKRSGRLQEVSAFEKCRKLKEEE